MYVYCTVAIYKIIHAHFQCVYNQRYNDSQAKMIYKFVVVVMEVIAKDLAIATRL